MNLKRWKSFAATNTPRRGVNDPVKRRLQCVLLLLLALPAFGYITSPIVRPDSALDLEIDDTLRNLQTINTGYALRREAQEAYAADQVNRALWDYQLNQQIDHMWDQTPQRAYAGAK